MAQRWLSLLFLSGVAVACSASRSGELEPRYVAVHNALSATGLVQIGPVQQGSLAEGRDQRLHLDLGAGCSTVVVLGGPGVRDLDVALLDADDKPLVRDTTLAPQATVRACPEVGGRFTLAVRMAAGAGDFLAATWAGGAAMGAPSAASAAPPVAAVPAGGGSCESPIPLTIGDLTGNTRRGDAEHAGSCASADSKELIYKLELQRRQRVTIEVNPQQFDSVLYIRKDDCADADAEVACNDDMSGSRSSSRGSRLDEVLDAGTYYVFVDGYGSDVGTFRMRTALQDVPSLADACRQIRPLTTSGVSGTLSGSFNHAPASCGNDAAGPDRVFRVDVQARSRVRFVQRSSDHSPVVHLRRQCADDHSEVSCSSSGLTNDQAALVRVLDAGSYALFVDSSDKDAQGNFTLATDIQPESGSGVAGDGCADATVLRLDEPSVIGDTFAARDDTSPRCAGQGAPDVVYRFDLAKPSRVTARFAHEEGNHVFAIVRACGDRASELACGSSVDEVLPAGSYFLVVDGAAEDGLGRFEFAFQARDTAAQEQACRAPPVLVAGKTIQGTTVGAGDRFTTSCAGREDLQRSPDRVYKIVLASRARVKLELVTPSWDGVIAIRRACVAAAGTRGAARNAEAACVNDTGDVHHARIETTLEAGTYFVVVDGHASGNEGPFTLQYEVSK